MNIILSIPFNEKVNEYKQPKSGFEYYWRSHCLGKKPQGWYVYADVNIISNLVSFSLTKDLEEVAASFEGNTYLKSDMHRHPGVYECGKSTRLVLWTYENSKDIQKLEYFTRDLAELKTAVRHLLDGLLMPTYPLSRPQGAPTYEKLTELVSMQSDLLALGTERYATAVKVVNAAQQLVLKLGAENNHLRTVMANCVK